MNSAGEQQIRRIFEQEVLPEILRAVKKHPKWPTDLCRQALIVGEESGELQQAVLNAVEYSEAGWDIDFAPDRLHYNKLQNRIDEEAVQVAAMALRFLLGRR